MNKIRTVIMMKMVFINVLKNAREPHYEHWEILLKEDIVVVILIDNGEYYGETLIAEEIIRHGSGLMTTPMAMFILEIGKITSVLEKE
jgi:hypothetical protein